MPEITLSVTFRPKICDLNINTKLHWALALQVLPWNHYIDDSGLSKGNSGYMFYCYACKFTIMFLVCSPQCICYYQWKCNCTYVGVLSQIKYFHFYCYIAILEGESSRIFTSPEAVLSLDQQWRGMLRTDLFRKHICLLAFDEAHCITNWYVGV